MTEKRLDVLDGLRGIAVLLVLWYHVWEITWLPAPLPQLEFIPQTGFIGVHLFFFLSGLVIVYPFARSAWAAAPPPTWRHFAWRRFVKIVPSYVLSIAGAFAIGYAATQSSGNVVADFSTHLLFIHTWFNATYGTINGVLWTLAVEIQFYLCFPLIWQAFKRRPWLTAIAMVSIAWIWRAWAAAVYLNTNFEHLEENLPGYLDLFACGMLTAYVYVRHAARGVAPLVRTTAPLVAIAAGAVLVFLLQDMFNFRSVPQWSYVWQIDKRPLLGLAFALFALASLVAPAWWRRAIGNPVLILCGTISYNLYLCNQIVARELLWHHIPPYSGDPHLDHSWQLAYTATAIAASIAVAAAITYAVERPLLTATPRFLIAPMARRNEARE